MSSPFLPPSNQPATPNLGDIDLSGLLNDPIKKQFLLKLLANPTEVLKSLKENGAMTNTPRIAQPKDYESPTALCRRRMLERNKLGKSPKPQTLRPSKIEARKPYHEILSDVIAFVEVKSQNQDRSPAVRATLEAMGATVRDNFTQDVTHVVFKDGSYNTFQRARLMRVHFVSVMWIAAVKENKRRVSERKYPAFGTETFDKNVSMICLQLQNDFEEVVREEMSASATKKKRRQTLAPVLSANRFDLFRTKQRKSMINSSNRTSDESSSNAGVTTTKVVDMSLTFQEHEVQGGAHFDESSELELGGNKENSEHSELASFALPKKLSAVSTPKDKRLDDVDKNMEILFGESSKTRDSAAESGYNAEDDSSDSLVVISDSEEEDIIAVPTPLLQPDSEIAVSLNDSSEILIDLLNDAPVMSKNDGALKNTIGQVTSDNDSSKSTNLTDDSRAITKSDSSRMSNIISATPQKTKKNRKTTNIIDELPEKLINDSSKSTNISEPYRTPSKQTPFKSVRRTQAISKNDSSKSTNITDDSRAISKNDSSRMSNIISATPQKTKKNRKTSNIIDELPEKLINDSSKSTNISEPYRTPSKQTPFKSTRRSQAISKNDSSKSTNITDDSREVSTSDSSRKSSMSDIFSTPRQIPKKNRKTTNRLDELPENSISDSSKSTNISVPALIPSKKTPLKSVRRSQAILKNDSSKSTNITDDSSEISISDSSKSTNMSEPSRIPLRKKSSSKSSSSKSTNISEGTNNTEPMEVDSIVSKATASEKSIDTCMSSLRISNGTKSFDDQSFSPVKINKIIKSLEDDKVTHRRKSMRPKKQPELYSTPIKTPKARKPAPIVEEMVIEATQVEKPRRPRGKVLYNPDDSIQLEGLSDEQEREERRILAKRKSDEKLAKSVSPPKARRTEGVQYYAAAEKRNILVSDPADSDGADSDVADREVSPTDIGNILKIMAAAKKSASKKKKPPPPRREYNSDDDEQKDLAAEILQDNFKTPSRKAPRVLQVQTEGRQIAAKRRSVRLTQIAASGSNRRSTMEFQPLSQLMAKKKNGSRLPSIVCTKMHRDETELFMNIVKDLKGFVVEDQVTSRTTHLVAGEVKRTINMLKALAYGCWIVKVDWMEKSLENGKWAKEEDYEAVEFSPAVRHCRRQRQAFGPNCNMDIFKNCGDIYITKLSSPKYSDLVDLVEICHGTVTKTKRSAKIVVGELDKTEGVFYVSELWILDSITANKLMPFKKYKLIGGDVSDVDAV